MLTDIISHEQGILPSHETLNALMTTIPGVVYQFKLFPNGDWTFLYLSPGIESLYEVSPGAAYANPDALTNCILPEDRPSHRASVEQANHILASWEHEHRIRTPSGQVKWVRGQATPTPQPDGSVLWAGILTDVTQHKQTEEALQLSEARYRAIVEGQTDLVCRFLPDGTLTYVNDAYCRYFGQSSEAMLASNFMPLIPEADRAFVADQLTLCNADHPVRVYEHRVIRGDGEVRWIQWTDQMIFDQQGRPAELQSVGRDMTERKQVEESLVLERDSHRNLLETVEAIIVAIDPDGRISLINRKGCELLGYSADELIGKDWFENCLPPTVDRTQIREVFKKTLALDLAGSEYFENAVLTRSGAERLIAWHNRTLRDREDNVIGVLSAGEDITERKQAEEKRQLAASVFTHAREGILITSADGTILEVNDAFTDITGYSRQEVMGHNPRILGSGLQDETFFTDMWRNLIETGQWTGEIWNRRKNGDLFAMMQTVSAVHDPQGNIQHYVALFSDITALKEKQRQLERIAHYDPLTKLPNRVLLADRLHQDMAQTQRREQYLGVVYLDLDGFKAINDRYGHAAGDQILISTANRMKDALRKGDTIARLGGDEFAAVLVDLTAIEDCVPLLNRLLAAAAEPVQVGDLVLQVSASVGVTVYPQADEVDGDQLLRQADHAMYQAKQTGKNRFRFFDTEQDSGVPRLHEKLDRIRRALADGEFVLHYQPKVNLRTGTVIGVEALIRWRHPTRGLLAPALFLPMIEDHPLAVELGEWVIEAALRQMEDWHASGLDLPVSVNIGARQLQQNDFVDRLRALLAAHPAIDPSCLALEVLETSAMDDFDGVSQVVDACRQLGVTCALDDFGTGYSSLTYLKRLAVTLFKIDRSFVLDMLDNPEDLAIVESTLGLAKAFRRQALAEGVETQEHGEMLLQLGCELAQGFGIARPMPAHEVSGWLAAWHTPAYWSGMPAMNRDDLPLLFVGAEHRAWVAVIEHRLESGQAVPLSPDHRHCRLGAWLQTEGLTRYGTRPSFQTLVDLHQQAHRVADGLLELQKEGRRSEALARLGELHQVRDALLEQLREIAR